VAYYLASLDWCYVFTPVCGQPYLSASAHAGVASTLDAANQDVSNGYRL